MTIQEDITIFRDVVDMTQVSKGYQHLVRWLKEEIKEGQEKFLGLKTDQDRFEIQVRLKTLNEVLGWADEAISRGKSREALEQMKRQPAGSLRG